MSTNARNQPRQPKGVPAGGQWRATTRPEGSITLAEPTEEDEWESWETREAAVVERIDSYHPECARRWASDSLADARLAHERATSLAGQATGANFFDVATARETRERALAALAVAEKHAGLGRTMVVEVSTDASVDKMTSLAGGDEGWCIAGDIVAFEPAGGERWRLTGPEWYVRGHVRSVVDRRQAGWRVVEVRRDAG